MSCVRVITNNFLYIFVPCYTKIEAGKAELLFGAPTPLSLSSPMLVVVAGCRYQ